jgi:hypothetical protein
MRQMSIYMIKSEIGFLSLTIYKNQLKADLRFKFTTQNSKFSRIKWRKNSTILTWAKILWK